MPTFSWPQMSGYSIWRSCGVPAYCMTSPRKVCLSVPQMPDIDIWSTTAPGSGSGSGNSWTSSSPGCVMTAALTGRLIAQRPAEHTRAPAFWSVPCADFYRLSGPASRPS